MSPTQRIAERLLISNLLHDLLDRGAKSAVPRATDTRTGVLVAIKALDAHVVSG